MRHVPIGSRNLDWLIPHRVPNIFPEASEPYRCIPPPVPFNVTSDGHLLTTGLFLNHSKTYCCYNGDINGTIFFDLSVTGYPPLKTSIQTLDFSSRSAEYIYIEWRNVATPLQPVNQYTLLWNATEKDEGGVVDTRSSHVPKNGSVTTSGNNYFLQYEKGYIYRFAVYGGNDAGRSEDSEQREFNVDVRLEELNSGGPDRLEIWALILIIIMVILCCCICWICLLLCLCCLCGCRRNRKKTYYAEEQGMFII